MNKKTLIIVIAVVILVGGAIFFLNRDTGESLLLKESIILEEDVMSIGLTTEEIQALADQGLEAPSSGPDAKTETLQGVRFSDDLNAIEADIEETNLTGIDMELETIENDLLTL